MSEPCWWNLSVTPVIARYFGGFALCFPSCHALVCYSWSFGKCRCSRGYCSVWTELCKIWDFCLASTIFYCFWHPTSFSYHWSSNAVPHRRSPPRRQACWAWGTSARTHSARLWRISSEISPLRASDFDCWARVHSATRSRHQRVSQIHRGYGRGKSF